MSEEKKGKSVPVSDFDLMKKEPVNAEEKEVQSKEAEAKKTSAKEEKKDSESLETVVNITSRQYDQMVDFLNKYDIDTDELSRKEVVEKYQKIAKIKEEQFQVLSRGRTVDSIDRVLKKFVPKGYKGQLFRKTETDFERAKALGWNPVEVDGVSKEDSPTGIGGSYVQVGDLVLFVTPEENYVAGLINKEERNRRRREASKARKNNPEQGDQFGATDPSMPLMPIEQLGV